MALGGVLLRLPTPLLLVGSPSIPLYAPAGQPCREKKNPHPRKISPLDSIRNLSYNYCGMKTCNHCHRELPLAAFPKNQTMEDGLCPRCRECCAESQWKYNHSEKGKTILRQRTQSEEGRARGRAAQRRYYQSEKGKAAKQQYRQSGKAKAATRRFQQSEKGKAHRKRDKLKLLYGISVDDYDEMLARQNGCCAICGSELIGGQQTHIDHNHTTGKVRALLCGHCNRMLGQAREDPEILAKAIEYLQSH